MLAARRFLSVTWLLPIAIAVAALMVLPGGAFLASGLSGGVHTASLGGSSGALGGLHAESSGALANGIPSGVLNAPWVASLTHSGAKLHALTSVPNLGLLKHPLPTNGIVSPFYVSQPAPLGVADYGLGATPYSYNVSRLMGQVTLSAPPNVTDPASGSVIEPGGASEGFVGSFHEFGVQLNTVATNMSIPHNESGFFWTQNVINWNDTGIHFVDDTFNLTSATQNPFVIEPGTIYSACHTQGAGVQTILTTYGGVFQCVGGTVPISPASYPITVQLFNNASVNAQHRTQVAYGYRIVEAGTGTVVTGISDTVVFNSPSGPHHRPGFSIDAFGGAPAGLFRDAEMVLVGDIGGDNAVFRSISGSVQLQYTNASSGGWASVPSAYNFGGDTGETSAGIADYWTSGGVLHLNQGPSMLYGLWNAVPWASVASGAIQVSGSVTPSYAFVFVSNTPPVRDPFGTGKRDNMSWLPTASNGSFSTWLPPLGAPWTTKYYVQAFADGFAEKNGTGITGSTTTYHLALKSAPGTLNAPLGAYSNPQAADLALHVTGSAAAPFVFNGLVVNENFTFEHVNDYGYAEFTVLQFQGVSHAVYVNNTTQGNDAGTVNRVIYDFSGPGAPGVVVPAPFNTTSSPFFTSGINIFEGTGDRVSNQTAAEGGYHLQVNLWKDAGARVWDITTLFGSFGVWVGDSTGTTVSYVSASVRANGVSDVGSSHTTASWLSSNGPGSFAYWGVSSAHATVSHAFSVDGAIALDTGNDVGAGAAYDPYYYLAGVATLHASWITAINATGANVTLSSDATISHVTANNGSIGIITDNSLGVTTSAVTATNQAFGVVLFATTNSTVDTTSASQNSTAVYLWNTGGTSVGHVVADWYTIGVVLRNAPSTTILSVTALHHSTAVLVV